jgi:predicted nucleotidyltransferase
VSAIGRNAVPSVDECSTPTGQPIHQAFAALAATLNERGVRYAIIGGMALIQHTRLRTTDDIDVLLTIPQVETPGLFEALSERGFTVDLNRNIRELRDDGFTSLLFGNVVIDLMQPVIPTYAHVLDRAISTEILGHRVRICSAEGLIITKLIAMRSQDAADVQELLAAYGDKLDLAFVRAELETFTKLHDPRRETFEGWVRQAASQG